MSDNTKIEWADATANYINGCSVVSPGCTNCYAMRLAGTRMKHHPTRAGLTDDSKAGPVWNGTVRTNDKVLAEVLAWKRPRRIFWNAHGDLFHPAVSDETIDRQFAVMALTPQHQHLVLTKRPERMRQYLTAPYPGARWENMIRVMPGTFGKWDRPRAIAKVVLALEPLANVWLGTSVEDQARADERIPHLLATPAAVRFISAEPLLGPVDLRWIAEPDDEKHGVIDALLGCNWVQVPGDDFLPARPGHRDRKMGRWVVSSEADILAKRKIDWVIVGGESGPNARPMHPGWARSLRDQCAAARVPMLFKQWGEWAPPHQDIEVIDAGGQSFHWFDDRQLMEKVGKKAAGRLLDGVQHDGFPA